MRIITGFFVISAAALLASSVAAQRGDVELAIQQPLDGLVLVEDPGTLSVQGAASIFGGVQQIDLMLVLDTSSSLKETDPEDFRKAGAIGLVESLPEWSDIQVGVVTFGRRAATLSPLTADRSAVVAALEKLERGSTTNLAGGIDEAVEGFASSGREGSTRVLLIFSDGKSNEAKARRAVARAQAAGISVHSLLLGRSRDGRAMLEDIASETGGHFLQVTDPEKLPEAFLDLRTTGIERVTLQVNDAPAVDATLMMGSFSAEVPLERGENVIVATAVTRDGREVRRSTHVTLQPPGCAELAIQAVRDGEPAVSLSQRSVELVVDASRSMWGQIDGTSKMDIAKATLVDALAWMPTDLDLSLRAYGSQRAPSEGDCQDTVLLVPGAAGNRPAIRDAVSALRPKGQTPLGFALEQVADDFGDLPGERAVVLVTDGIESCGGDAVSAARALQANGHVPVHVIGFGLKDAGDEDLASLQAIADASGGRFVTAGSAGELQEALIQSVGTPFEVRRDDVVVGHGTLGAPQALRLPAGDYSIHLESQPPIEAFVTLASEVRETVVFRRESGEARHASWRDTADYATCEEGALASMIELGPPTAASAREPASASEPAPPAMAASSEGSSSADPAASPEHPDAPKARREMLLEVEAGTIELWRNLRPQRTSDWGVVLRREGSRPSMLYSGNDRDAAEAAAKNARDTLRRGGSIEDL